MSDARLIYVTVGDTLEAERIADTLVVEHLVACANILGGVKSIYFWQGKLEKGAEVALILKTTEDLVSAAITRTKSLHSYDCPAIVVLPIVDGNEAFLQWIRAETHTAPG